MMARSIIFSVTVLGCVATSCTRSRAPVREGSPDIVRQITTKLEEQGATFAFESGVPVAVAIIGGNQHGSKVARAQLCELAKLHTLQALQLRGLQLDDELLSCLTPLREIRYLDLSKNQLTATGCKALQAFDKLVSIDLSLNSIGAEGVAALASCKALRRLNVFGNQLADGDLQELNKCSALEWLKVGEDPWKGITDAGIMELDLPDLKVLDITFTGVRGRTLATASFRDSLVGLYASNSRFDDEGAHNIRGFSALRHLDISGSRITDSGIKDICAVAGLRYLDISATKTGNASIDQLRRLESLRKIDIWKTQIDEAAFAEACPKVERLYTTDLRWFPKYEALEGLIEE